MHILNVIIDQNMDKTSYLKTITIKKLEEVTQEAMASWFNDKDKPKNAEKKVFLSDIVRVARMEERYRKGEIGMLPGTQPDSLTHTK